MIIIETLIDLLVAPDDKGYFLFQGLHGLVCASIFHTSCQASYYHLPPQTHIYLISGNPFEVSKWFQSFYMYYPMYGNHIFD